MSGIFIETAAAEEIHIAEIGLAFGKALIRGFLIPLDGLGVVTRQTIFTVRVFHAQRVLRRRIAAISRGDNVV